MYAFSRCFYPKQLSNKDNGIKVQVHLKKMYIVKVIFFVIYFKKWNFIYSRFITRRVKHFSFFILMIRVYISWMSKIQYFKVFEYLHLSFIKRPSLQFKFRYLLFFETTIMGKTDLAMVQKTITDTLHKEGQAKLIQTLGRASQGVNWSWSQCIKSHHAQTSSGKELPSHFWNRNIVGSILSGLKRKRTGLLLSCPKSYFQMKVNFAFNLEIKVPESGGRAERHKIQPAWSPV